MDKLATFRVQDTEWSAFQALCKESGSNASKELIGFIRECLKSGQVGTIADQTIAQSGVTLDDVNAIVNAIVSPLQDELGKLRELLGKSQATKEAQPIKPKTTSPKTTSPKPIATATKNPNTPTPIAGAVGGALTTGKAHAFLYARKLYKKQLAAFRTALRRARELDPAQLPDELVAIGLSADFETWDKANNPKDNTVRWLRVEQGDRDS